MSSSLRILSQILQRCSYFFQGGIILEILCDFVVRYFEKEGRTDSGVEIYEIIINRKKK